jgi:hypothetical protein
LPRHPRGDGASTDRPWIPPRRPVLRKTKVFDPTDGFGAVKDLVELSDVTLFRREDRWGPYVIAFLEGDGSRWADEPVPAFRPAQGWEQGSVFEPNLIYFNGKWRM